MLAKRDYDIILYGASGYTARFIIKELEHSTLKIALSARTVSKIHESSLPKIQCSVECIRDLTRRTKLLINCVGPYAYTGDTIISACIETYTNYLDISGETRFLSDIFQKYNSDAKSNKVKIVQGCGFDSVPADIGTMHLSRMFDSVSIDSTIKLNNCKINICTWESLLNSFRQQQTPNYNKFQESYSDKIIKPSRVALPEYRYNKGTASYDVLFRGSDSYVVKRSTAHDRRNSPYQIKYAAYLNIGSYFNLILYLILGFIIKKVVRFSWAYNFLLENCDLISFNSIKKNGPTLEEISKSSFEMSLVASGMRNKKSITRTLKISGPDPGYTSTAIFVTQCAFALIENESKIDCGVLTPAQAFRETKIIDMLVAKGIYFEMK